MNANRTDLIESELTSQVIACFFDVFNELGPGFVESVYENALVIALRERGLDVRQQCPLQVWFRGTVVGEFRTDLLVATRVVVELKAVTQLAPAHEVQLVNYLKACRIPVGLLLNFGPKPQFKRRVLTPIDENPRSSASTRVKNND